MIRRAVCYPEPSKVRWALSRSAIVSCDATTVFSASNRAPGSTCAAPTPPRSTRNAIAGDIIAVGGASKLATSKSPTSTTTPATASRAWWYQLRDGLWTRTDQVIFANRRLIIDLAPPIPSNTKTEQ
jgi:hypothetical protein